MNDYLLLQKENFLRYRLTDKDIKKIINQSKNKTLKDTISINCDKF